MRLHRFYLNEEIPEVGSLKVEDNRLIHQWKNVFRYKEGDQTMLFNGNGFEYGGLFEKLEKSEALIKIVSKKEAILPEKKIVLYQSLVKKDKMEWVAEKATELGVSKIVPVISERSEKKDLNLERIRKIVIEASEQCGRGDAPLVTEVVSLVEALGNCDNAIVFDSLGSPFRDSLLVPRDSFSLFIGPEGGWSDFEIEKFKDLKIEIFSLGKLTLRAETAAIVALTKFL